MTKATALVTGGSSGIGLATVATFASRGVRVALNYLPDDIRGNDEVARLKADGLDVVAAPGDISKPQSAASMVANAIEKLGRLDYLINNAGTAATASPIPLPDLDRLDDQFWQKILSTNLVGAFRCAKAAAAALRQSNGAIVNTASIGGIDAVGSSIAYGASKAGVINLTKNLARALSPNVRVNAVAPGFVESPWTKDWPKERVDQMLDRTLLKKACSPDDIAEVIWFLSADAKMMTGQTLVVDAGFMLGY